jgi:hypothetical protein
MLWELLLGKRVRAWNGISRLAARNPHCYQHWRSRSLPLLIRRWIDLTAAGQKVVQASLGNTGDTTLANWLDSVGNADWVVPKFMGDTLDSMLDSVIATAVSRHAEATMIYWDEDFGSLHESAQPWIKPDWDPLLHAARDCLAGAVAIRLPDANAMARMMPDLPANEVGLAQLLSGMLAAGHRPVHVPLVLSHRSGAAGVPSCSPVLSHSALPGWNAAARTDGLPFQVVTPADPLVWPSVSIIIPTRDRAKLLQTCLNGLDRLQYPGAVDIIVIDNGSQEADALALLADAAAVGRLQVVRDDVPFNFSRLNNKAAAFSRSEYLCLLNNDVEALDGVWLTAMVRHVVQPGIGAVGACLLYPDGSIQHAGVSIGTGGAAGHTQRGVYPHSPEHAGWHAVSRQVSAVTGACLLVSAANYPQCFQLVYC